MNGPRDTFDVVIAGGGLVGASLACALSGQGLRIAVGEAAPLATEGGGAKADERVIALAHGSRRILAGLGLWPRLEADATPIHEIHVSDKGRFGFVHLRREDEGVEALGYVVPARVLGQAFTERLRKLPDVDLICPAEIASARSSDTAEVVVRTDAEPTRALTARMLVAADGTRSMLRELFDIPTTVWDYGQTAIISNVHTQLPHRNVAFERFTPDGPLAVLPMEDNRCAVVWTWPNDHAVEAMSLDDAAFLARLQAAFGQRLGRFMDIGRREAFPLRLVRARAAVGPRLALVGNAAHTLHPIAGQGFNLGLRDVAALRDVLVDAHRAGQDIGSAAVLNRYARWRTADHRRVVAFTDGLIRVFTNPLAPVACLRDAAMVALDLVPPAKRLFARLAMGRAGRLPSLAQYGGME